MSIHFVSGKPGGGKTLYGLKLIVEELVLGKREIFTNVPLNLPELNAYVQARYPGASVDLFRIRLLDDAEVALFWTYRPGGVRIARLTKEQWGRGELPSYAGVADHGVMYVIDEIHNFFGARQWAQTGQDVLFYLSQHRKLSDTVICITQAIANVDKQFRSVTQDFTFVRNLSKETYGRFRLPGIFVRKTFSSPPTETTSPMETGTFKLDVAGLASCYNSAQGVGIHGRSADKGEVKRGLSWWWYFIIIGAVLFVVFGLVPRAVGRMFLSPMRAGVSAPAAASVASGALARSVPVPVVYQAGPLPSGGFAGPSSVGSGFRAEVTKAGVPVRDVEAVTVTTCVVWAGKVVIGLSDGRMYQWPRDLEVQLINEKMVVISGVVYRRHL